MLSFASLARISKQSYSSSSRCCLLGVLPAICVVAVAAIDNDDNYINEESSSFIRRFLPTTTITLSESATPSPQEKSNDDSDDGLLFGGQCLKRQMHVPNVPYPLWDYNWDGKMTSDTSLEAFRNGQANSSNSNSKKKKKGAKKSRHILLVRHGQYDERREEDIYRILTPLGRRQAIQTGIRLTQIARGSMNFEKNKFNGKFSVKAIHVSNMVRAKETAQLIAQQFQDQKVFVQKPDPLLNEALPAPMVPIRPDIIGATEEIDEHHDRIEEAFRKYFYRNDDDEDVTIPPTSSDEDADDEGEENEEDEDKNEFEVIVCHGNMIRYFFCRALQLPPEAWLRLCTFNCSITYLVIRPNGMVSARMMGDIGHLDYDDTSFSGLHGFKW
jgi:serine/threonine-protein phosphatase PGAM5